MRKDFSAKKSLSSARSLTRGPIRGKVGPPAATANRLPWRDAVGTAWRGTETDGFSRELRMAKKRKSFPYVESQAIEAAAIRDLLSKQLVYGIGKDKITATDRDWFYTVAAVTRERVKRVQRKGC